MGERSGGETRLLRQYLPTRDVDCYVILAFVRRPLLPAGIGRQRWCIGGVAHACVREFRVRVQWLEGNAEEAGL